MIALDDAGKTYRTRFGRRITALGGVSLRIAPGEVVGLAGPNGAGKSTLIALLLGFARPSSGRVALDGLEPRRWVERHGAGYVPELIAIPPRWTVDGALARYAALAGLSGPAARDRCAALLERFALAEHRDKRVKQLSHGTRQRLALAQALMRPERLYILDEPTHGLDPLWTIAFREVVDSLRSPDAAILIASHDLGELERIADRVVILDRGTVRAEVGARTATPRRRLTVREGAALVPGIFPGAQPAGERAYDLEAGDLDALNRGLAELLRRGAIIESLEPVRDGLEAAFRAAVDREPS